MIYIFRMNSFEASEIACKFLDEIVEAKIHKVKEVIIF